MAVLRGIAKLLISVCDYDVTGVKEDGVRAGGCICVKRTATVLRGSLKRLGHILVS